MPFFDDNPLQRLALEAPHADAVLDLRGCEIAEALRAIEDLLQRRGPAESYLVRFDPATGDGRETPFLPLGRRLLQARRDGVLMRCLPSADGAGYFIAFATASGSPSSGN